MLGCWSVHHFWLMTKYQQNSRQSRQHQLYFVFANQTINMADISNVPTLGAQHFCQVALIGNLNIEFEPLKTNTVLVIAKKQQHFLQSYAHCVVSALLLNIKHIIIYIISNNTLKKPGHRVNLNLSRTKLKVSDLQLTVYTSCTCSLLHLTWMQTAFLIRPLKL